MTLTPTIDTSGAQSLDKAGFERFHVRSARFYPRSVVQAEGKTLVDQFGDRGLLLYLDPATHSLLAIYSDAASPRCDGSVLELGGQGFIRDGRLYDPDGRRLDLEQPR